MKKLRVMLKKRNGNVVEFSRRCVKVGLVAHVLEAGGAS
jgi:hypothetical protein